MRYLVTGGAGFIGSHLAEHLLHQGHQVHVFDNLSTGSLTNVQHLRYHQHFEYTVGNVLDLEALDPLVGEADRVVHLAAAVGVKLIMEQPVETIETNVHGTENVLKLAARHGCKVLVASTSEVYGKTMETNGAITRLHEDGNWTLGPTSRRRWAYACAKAIDEFLALAYHDEKGLPVVIARFFNTVGPRQTGRYGMVIPRFVQRALRGDVIEVYGDGTQTRCFTHVGDVVRAVSRLMETPGVEGQVFNIGGEEEISINALAERVCRLTKSDSEIVHVPYEEVYGPGFEDMQRRTPDISRLQSVIGYEPSYTTDDILQDVISYFEAGEGEAVAVFQNNSVET